MLVTNDERFILPSHKEKGVVTIGKTLREKCAVKKGDRLLLAVSGGADSAALLLALAALSSRREHAYHLTVGHVDHNLRSGESSEDACVVRKWCESLHIPCLIEKLDSDELSTGNLEAEARKARYRVLAEFARSTGAGLVLTAHHAQDQLETVLMALIRGAGPAAMAGMNWQRNLQDNISLVRPMLALDHDWAVQLCRQCGLVWREDLTNLDTSRTRSAIRHQILPLLESLRPGVARRVVDSGQIWRQAADLLRQAALDAMGQGFTWERAELASLPPAVVMEGFRQAAARLVGRSGADQISLRKLAACDRALRDNVTSSRKFQLGNAVEVVVAAYAVIMNKPDTRAED
ncbi:MAG TPA: tRNA lysidine(34) synthetase TilS [Phycisphaeraceae bacterium]|nr:tRNA lysidine(34) synthetase TilS [Phycisphaeraceae bacterium]